MLAQHYRKYKEILWYAFFGGCTTLVNLVAYYILTRSLRLEVLPATLLAWFTAVIFAYLTNRRLVFHSENRAIKAILLEFLLFVGCRLLTGVLDLGIMYVFADRMKLPDLEVKLVSNILVIITNYIASRFFIFRKHADGGDKKGNEDILTK